MSNEEYLAAKSSEVWTEFDITSRALPPEYLGQPKANYYSHVDWSNGLCPKELIGKPKPLAQCTSSERTYAQKLNELSEAAVDTVLNHPGGAKKWFQENPSAHVRVLVKLATPTAPDPQARIVIEIPWVQQGRLSYRESSPVEQVTEVQDVAPKQLEPWKDPPQDPGIGLGVNTLKKSLS